MAASYLAAPRLSKEEEEREKASLTDEEKLSALSDLYGALPIPTDELNGLQSASIGTGKASELSSVATEETKEMVSKSLDELENELAKALASGDDGDSCIFSHGAGNGAGHHPLLCPIHVSTASYREAQKKCPNIVGSREHRLLFLRAEGFDAKLAAMRMLRYWAERVSLFGEAHAFGPLTLASGALDTSSPELSIGYPRVSPERDRSGRALIIFNQSVIARDAYDRKGMIRVCWFRVHKALEDEQVQRNGFVLVGLGYGRLDQLDRKLDSLLWRNVQDYLPCRMAGLHLVYGSNHYTYTLIAPNIKFFFGRSARARLREYTCSEAQTLEELKRFGIDASSLPVEMGGRWAYNNQSYGEEKAPHSAEGNKDSQ